VIENKIYGCRGKGFFVRIRYERLWVIRYDLWVIILRDIVIHVIH
jgi:hypothetical protein